MTAATGARAVVAVVAHPDDESLIAGGTLALAAGAGARTGVVSLTRGELGPISDPALATPETLGAVREAELAAAGAALGVDWTECLDLPDGELPWVDHAAAVARVAELAGPGPAALLTFGEDGLYGHPDHVAAREVALAAAARLGDGAWVYEAAWPAETVPALVAAARERGLGTDLWGLEAEAFGSPGAPPALVVDAGPVLERKLAAVRAHRTQLAEDHLLHALPDDLARQFLCEEPWRVAWPQAVAGGGVLEAVLA